MRIVLKNEAYAKFKEEAKAKGMSTRELGTEILEKHLLQ